MISIQQMQYILALSEERQFQRASDACFVTQPTLSMQLKKAESTLGSQIFDRSTIPLELTPFGESLIPIIRDVLNEYQQLKVLAEKQKGIYKERIRIAIIPTIATYMLPDLFEEWKQILEEIQLTIVEMKTEDLLVALDTKKIDLGILAGPVIEPKLRTTVLYREEILAFIPQIKAKEVSTNELESYHPWLLTQGNCLRTQMIHFCHLNNDAPEDWNYEGGNMELLKQMVELHGGYTLVPERSIGKPSPKYKRIRSESGEIPAREVVAVMSTRNAKWTIAEKLIRTIQLYYATTDQSKEFKLLSWN
ncbi:MAG: LysR family hydrogen peroxide-inducible transcriptional activator [Crocinitomicaceae bacterium]|jgi:LysR family hydrogen peroxide-inducible transcriptional activator